MRGSLKRRGKRWRLVFDLSRDDNGKRRQVVVSFKGNKKDAETELNRLIAEVESGGFVEPNKLTVGKYLKFWLKDVVASTVAPKTHERYSELVNLHLIPALGTIKLRRLTSTHILNFYSDLRLTGRRDGRGGLSERSILHIHHVLKGALRQTMLLKPPLLRFNPADGVTAPSPEDKEIETIDEQQMARLLDGAEGTTLYIPVLIAASTGLRRGETLALRWRDIDLDRNSLSVRRTLEQTKAGLRFKPPKTKRGKRVVTLPAFAVDALRRHKVEQAKTMLRIGRGRTEDGLVCSRFDGEPRSPRAFSKEFTRLVAKLDIPRVSFHGLRHSHASQLLRSGMNMKITQERLGHTKISTTLDIYSHVSETMQKATAVVVNDVLTTALEKLRQEKRSQKGHERTDTGADETTPLSPDTPLNLGNGWLRGGRG